MQVPETRFVRIEGKRVSVAVTSSAEARHAMKELRLVKREALRHRRVLAKAEKAAKASSAKNPSGKPRRAAAKRSGAAVPVIDNPLSYVWHSLAAVASAATAGEDNERAKPAARNAPANKSSATLTREIARVDEILAGIDTCLAQIEAKLLDEKAPRRAKPVATPR